MIYNGKLASQKIKENLKERISALGRRPSLVILSVGTHPSTTSFITIKRRYAEDIGVAIKEIPFEEEKDESSLLTVLASLSEENAHDGIIVQLPLPPLYDTEAVLNAIPEKMDVDVLGSSASLLFKKEEAPVPPVAGAVAHILKDTGTDPKGKSVVVIGKGRLVGTPVATWFTHQGSIPHTIDIDTDEESKIKLLKEADIVVTGVGKPKMLKPEHFKKGVVLVDAGTSEQGGMLSGDCDPSCNEIASVFTPVPGGVGPLTVACLFENVLISAEKRKK